MLMICGRLDSAKQLDSLQLQLHVMAEQRDSALLQLSSAQETISSYTTSLSNLQMVLEQFQAGEIADWSFRWAVLVIDQCNRVLHFVPMPTVVTEAEFSAAFV